MNIKIVRLKSGEELVAETSMAMSGKVAFLKNACILLPSSTPGGITLYKFLPYADIETLEIKVNDTYFIVDPQVDLINYYNEYVHGVKPIVSEDKIIQ